MGHGLTLLWSPTSVVVVGGLAIAKVRYDRYLRFVWPLLLAMFAGRRRWWSPSRPPSNERRSAVSDSTITLVTLGVVVVLFIWNRLPVELVAIGAALALYGLGVLTLQQSLAGFGDPAVILIGALFVVSEGLDATGVTTWVGQSIVQRAGAGRDATPAVPDAPQRRADGADRAQRQRRRAAADDGRHRDAAVVPGVPPADAVGVRRQCWWPAAPHRESGQRGHLAGRRRCRGRPLRLRRVRGGRDPRRDRDHRHRVAVRAQPAARPHERQPAAGSQPLGPLARAQLLAGQRRAPPGHRRVRPRRRVPIELGPHELSRRPDHHRPRRHGSPTGVRRGARRRGPPHARGCCRRRRPLRRRPPLDRRGRAHRR